MKDWHVAWTTPIKAPNALRVVPQRALQFSPEFGIQSRNNSERAKARMFENITVVGGPLVLSTATDVDAAEAQLGMHFPTGYRQYVTRFGEGTLGGSYIRVYPPHRILKGSN